ncbi:MAG: GvpL/GvpF family gas vesicle protein [Nitrospinota bacterium]
MTGAHKADGERNGLGLYAYCVLLDPEDLYPGMVGMDRSPVYVVAHRRLGMAVSRAPLKDFAPERVKAMLQDLAWVEPRVRRHEEVVEEIMRHRPVVPIRFGTLYLDETGVLNFLGEHEGELSESLQDLTGKQEWNVRVFVAKEGLRAALERGSERLRPMNREMEAKPPGQAYFLRKKKELVLAEEMDRRVRQWEAEFVGRLRSVAEEVVLNTPNLRKSTDGGEEMVLNAAFLVANDRLGEFRHALEGLSARYGDEGCSFHSSGPWPPYHFSPRLSSPSLQERRA